MSKGLGRGLSSLFAIYEEDEKKEKVEKTTKNEEKTEKNDTKTEFITKNEPVDNKEPVLEPKLNILSDAENLLEKYKVKTAPETESVNTEYLNNKQNLEEKIKNASQEMYSSSGVRQLALNRLQPNPDQPRKSFDQEALKELAQSIREHGVIQPIIVVPRGDNYVIIAGERRYRASKIVGLKTVPVIIKDYSEEEMRQIALIENLQREDLNPIETAMALKQLIDTYGLTQDEIAQKIGKSRPSIANTLRLLTLEPEVLTLVEKGKLQAGLARAIITLPRDLQIALAKKACDGKMTAREVERAVQEINKPEVAATNTKSNVLSLELISMREDMQQVFGTKVTIIGNNKKGRIYFDYYNKDDLDRIYELVNKLK